MPKATKHTIKAASIPTAKSSSQRSAKGKENVAKAPAKTAKQVLQKAALPIKADSKKIKKGSSTIAKPSKPEVFGKSNKGPVSHPPKKPRNSYMYFSNQMQE